AAPRRAPTRHRSFRMPARLPPSEGRAAKVLWPCFDGSPGFSSSLLDGFLLALAAECAASLRWKMQPDLGATGKCLVGCGDDPQGGAIRGFDHVVAVGAEEDLARHHRPDCVAGGRGRLRRELD